ncbi:hypothetical protein G4B88_020534 [Cannabis sativa]|uniref:Plant thionin family protein n=1 Tax=Cannabis sativa TaxID=3483 RepID=A0A7J6FK29_CANSA|nr:hypothetical protein G4B88_002995 [Cannabis sativa]KAF4374142.1 hypothetical protein G4B88_020534 [Cannabis sativa]
MANKNADTLTFFIMSILLVGAIFRTSEALTECAKLCMPVCLRETGAGLPACEKACEDYCKQISSNQDSNKKPNFGSGH